MAGPYPGYCVECGQLWMPGVDPGQSGRDADGRWRCDACYLDYCVRRLRMVEAWETHGHALMAAVRAGLPPVLALGVARALTSGRPPAT